VAAGRVRKCHFREKKSDYFPTVFGVGIIIITDQTFEPTESHHHRRQKGLTSYDL